MKNCYRDLVLHSSWVGIPSPVWTVWEMMGTPYQFYNLVVVILVVVRPDVFVYLFNTTRVADLIEHVVYPISRPATDPPMISLQKHVRSSDCGPLAPNDFRN